MGRPPSTGGPAFRFTQNEVAEMEAILQENKLQIPSKDLIITISERFSQSTERADKVLVQTKQVWNWFQNRRYALRSKFAKPPIKLTITQMPRVDVGPARNVPQGSFIQPAQSAGRNASDNTPLEFEAKSARDGAWYDVQAFVSHRYPDTRNPEVLVRFAGFGLNEEEWVNVRKHIRQRSLPCESSECVAVLPGDLVLCFQEGKEQALYFDAHILDAQRRRHDVRGCRCRFLVCYDHDHTEEIVPLRKICRRPETDYRLQQHNFLNDSASLTQKSAIDPNTTIATLKAGVPSQPEPLNHRAMVTNRSISVVTALALGNASDDPGNSQSEPMKVEIGAPVYFSFAGCAPTGANTPPSETAMQ